jgi:hypothetical protein
MLKITLASFIITIVYLGIDIFGFAIIDLVKNKFCYGFSSLKIRAV